MPIAAGSPHGQWARARPDLDLTSMEVLGPVRRARALIDLALEPLYEGAPLTAPELDVLIFLRHAESPAIARRLADRMGRSAAAMSKLLAKLERRGFITREVNPADRRAALVTIGALGVETVDAMFPRQLDIEGKLVAALGARRPEVVEALGTLVRILEQQFADGADGSAR